MVENDPTDPLMTAYVVDAHWRNKVVTIDEDV